MKGITNAPMGAGGSGGEWEEHTSSDWSDFITSNGTGVIFTKDCYIAAVNVTINYTSCDGVGFFPKGLTTTLPVGFPVFYGSASNNDSVVNAEIKIRSSDIIGNTVATNINRLSVSVASDFTVSYTRTNVTNTLNKSNLKVFTKG